jgi:hypothetical protein
VDERDDPATGNGRPHQSIPEWKYEFNGHTFKGNGWELSLQRPSWWKHQNLIKNELRPKFRKQL